MQSFHQHALVFSKIGIPPRIPEERCGTGVGVSASKEEKKLKLAIVTVLSSSAPVGLKERK